MNIAIPGWIVLVIGEMYRFVAGSFGVELPRPHKTTMCSPFWIALIGCTIALPIVLLCWAIRLALGRGKAERISVAIGKFMGFKPVKVALWCSATLAVVSLFWFFILEYGWLAVLFFILKFFGTMLIFIGVVGVVIFTALKIQTMPMLNGMDPGMREKVSGRASRTARVFLSVPIFPLKILWQIMVFMGLMIAAFYKKFCPMVEFP